MHASLLFYTCYNLKTILKSISIECSIPRMDNILLNCWGADLSKGFLGPFPRCKGAVTWTWISGATWPVTVVLSFHWTLNTSPGLTGLTICIAVLRHEPPNKWMTSGNFVLKWKNVFCRLWWQSPYCTKVWKNAWRALSFSTVLM